MAYEKYQLFRLKILKPNEPDLPFTSERTNNELIETGIKEAERCEIRRNQNWAIGNISDISPTECFFNFGRIYRDVSKGYDDESRRFVNVTHPNSKLANIFTNLETQLVAIAIIGNEQLTPQVVANYLCKVMKNAPALRLENASFVLQAIKHPRELVEQLRSAPSVKEFRFSVTNPNPFSPSDFQNATKKHLEETSGQQATVTSRGEALNAANLAKLAEEVGKYGDEVSAKILNSDGERTKISNKGNALSVTHLAKTEDYSDKQSLEWQRILMDKINNAYEGEFEHSEG